MRRTVCSLDGSEIDLESDRMALDGRANSSVRAEIAGELREFTAGEVPVGLDEDGFQIMGVPASRSYGLRSGSLIIGSGAPVDAEGHRSDFAWALWVAGGSALFGHFYGRDDSAIIAAMAALGPTLSDSGSVVLRADRTVRYDETPDVALADPTLGLLQVRKLTRRVARRLPKWEGARIAGGQLYADVTATDSCLVTLVSPTAVGYLVTNEGLDPDEAVGRASDIRLTWA
jgi:hypothetical protein